MKFLASKWRKKLLLSDSIHMKSFLERMKVAENRVFNICVIITFFSKTLDPSVTKNGSKEGFDCLADVCAVSMTTSINMNRPLKSVLSICKKYCC